MEPNRLVDTVTIPQGLPRAQALEYIAPLLGDIGGDETIVVVVYAWKLNGTGDFAQVEGEDDPGPPPEFRRLELGPKREVPTEPETPIP